MTGGTKYTRTRIKKHRVNTKRRLTENINNTQNRKWNNLREIIIQTAHNVIGITKRNRKIKTHDNEIEALSKEQKDIRIRIANSNNAEITP